MCICMSRYLYIHIYTYIQLCIWLLSMITRFPWSYTCAYNVNILYSHVVTPLSFILTSSGWLSSLPILWRQSVASSKESQIHMWALPCLILVSLFCGLPPLRGSGISMDDCPNWGCSRVSRESLFPHRSMGSGGLPKPPGAIQLPLPRGLRDLLVKISKLCLNLWFFFLVWIHTARAPSTAGTSTGRGAVKKKPGSAWLEGTPANGPWDKWQTHTHEVK